MEFQLIQKKSVFWNLVVKYSLGDLTDNINYSKDLIIQNTKTSAVATLRQDLINKLSNPRNHPSLFIKRKALVDVHRNKTRDNFRIIIDAKNILSRKKEN